MAMSLSVIVNVVNMATKSGETQAAAGIGNDSAA